MKIISVVFAYIWATVYLFFGLSMLTIPLTLWLGFCMGWY